MSNVFNKALSGRFWLTIVAAASFVILIRTMCKILIDKSADIEVEHIILLITNLALVIQNVFTSYFNKKREPDNGNGD